MKKLIELDEKEIKIIVNVLTEEKYAMECNTLTYDGEDKKELEREIETYKGIITRLKGAEA